MFVAAGGVAAHQGHEGHVREPHRDDPDPEEAALPRPGLHADLLQALPPSQSQALLLQCRLRLQQYLQVGAFFYSNCFFIFLNVFFFLLNFFFFFN